PYIRVSASHVGPGRYHTLSLFFFFFLSLRRPPSSPLFPYTTLFRSRALPRRDRRLADLHPHPVRCLRARAVGDGRGSAPSRLARDRKSTRLNSSHVEISYAVFCLKKKTKNHG